MNMMLNYLRANLILCILFFAVPAISQSEGEAPTIECEDLEFYVNDFDDYDNDGNICELATDIYLSNSATDLNPFAGEYISWIVQIDYWGDGTIDVEYSSFYDSDDANYIEPTKEDEELDIILEKEDATAQWARHIVKWKSFDDIGNVSQCTQSVSIKDGTDPDPNFKTELALAFDSEFREIAANTFNIASSDNCTPEDQLMYAFGFGIPNFDKLDQVHCFDESGEVSCSQYDKFGVQKWNPETKSATMRFYLEHWCGYSNLPIQVLDNFGHAGTQEIQIISYGSADGYWCCDILFYYTLTGRVLSTNNNPMHDAIIEIEREGHERNTDENGNYSFEEILISSAHNVTASYADDPLNGVSTLDLLLINKHILGLELFDNHYSYIAADINNDHNISPIDIVELRKLILGIYDKFPENDAWKIINKAFTLEQDAPFPHQEQITIGLFELNETDRDFIAIKMGDINANATANYNSEEVETRTQNPLEFIVDKSQDNQIQIRAGKNFSEVYGFQFALKTETKVNSISSATLEISENNYRANSDATLNISYHNINAQTVAEGELLFTIEGTDDIALNDIAFSNEAYLTDGYLVEGIKLREGLNVDLKTELLNSEPNPFVESTTVRFMQENKGKANIQIFDVSGQLIKSISKVFDKGTNSIQLNKADLQASGLYHLRYTYGEYSNTIKLLLLD